LSRCKKISVGHKRILKGLINEMKSFKDESLHLVFIFFDIIMFRAGLFKTAFSLSWHSMDLTLSVLGHMAAIVLRPFSGNFTRSETHAVKNSEEVLSYFFHLHSINN
jgi:hypothetical protein